MALGGELAGLRYVIAAAGLLVLIYWTYERLRGEDDDPALNYAKETETGATTMLFSGTFAVGLVALLVTMALWADIRAQPAIAAVPVGIVVAHWIVEKEERE
jgi:hypothetical protein